VKSFIVIFVEPEFMPNSVFVLPDDEHEVRTAVLTPPRLKPDTLFVATQFVKFTLFADARANPVPFTPETVVLLIKLPAEKVFPDIKLRPVAPVVESVRPFIVSTPVELRMEIPPAVPVLVQLEMISPLWF